MKQKKNLQTLLTIFSLFILAFLICMRSESNIFSQKLSSFVDSDVFKYIGWSMTQGKIPYLDLFDHKGLLIYVINYLGAIISPIQGVWIIEVIFMFVSVTFAYKLARKFVNKPISLLITIISFSLMNIYFEGGNLTEEYAIPFELIALNIFFDFFMESNKYSSTEITNENASKIRLNFKWFNISVFICGICFAAVIFLRANMIAVWFVFCLMVLIYCVEKKKYKELAKFIISFICGILLLTIPMIIYLLVNGALESFIEQYILFNMKYSAESEYTRTETIIFFLNNTVVIIAFIVMFMKLYREYKKKENWYFDLGYLIFMIITVLLTSMGGRQYLHYGMTIIPMLIYPYCILYKFLEKKEVKGAQVNLIVTAYLLLTIVVPFGLTRFNECSQYILKVKGNGSLVKEDLEVVNYIIKNTEKDDLISVFDNMDYIYLASQRQSASKYSYQIPLVLIDRNIMDEYLEDLKRNNAKVIVYPEFKDDNEVLQRMEAFLNENYTLELQNEKMKVYKIK